MLQTAKQPEAKLVPVDQVRVGRRKRKVDDRKVAELAGSIFEVGLLNPITLDKNYRLIAGAHRLEAFKKMNLPEIPAVLQNFTGEFADLDAELAEIDENLLRNELTALQQAKHLQRRDQILQAKGERAESGWNGNQYTGPLGGEKSSPPKTTVELGQEIGLSHRVTQQRKQIARNLTATVQEQIEGTGLDDKPSELLKLAKLSPEEQEAVAGKIVSGEAKNVRQAKKQMVAAELHAEPLPMPEGPFRVIVIDPPWKYFNRAEDETHRGANPYPELTVDEICEEERVPLRSLAHDDCILWLWTTNAYMRGAYDCLEAWGFTPKTILTWAKNKMGVGDWLRGKTEHCIMAVKGKPTVVLTNQTTLLEAPVREHSRKPDEFYSMVEELCPASGYLDMFARECRNEKWQVWGAETGRF